MTTLYTAKKYAVPALEAHCVDFLTKHLRADNAFMLLTQVQTLNQGRTALMLLTQVQTLNQGRTAFMLLSQVQTLNQGRTGRREIQEISRTAGQTAPAKCKKSNI